MTAAAIPMPEQGAAGPEGACLQSGQPCLPSPAHYDAIAAWGAVRGHTRLYTATIQQQAWACGAPADAVAPHSLRGWWITTAGLEPGLRAQVESETRRVRGERLAPAARRAVSWE